MTNHRITSRRTHRSVWLAALLLALPLATTAQSAPASSASPMDMSSMPGMVMPAPAHDTAKPVTKAPVQKASKKHVPVPAAPASQDMQGMDHSNMPDMKHGAVPGMRVSATPAASTPPSSDMPRMDHASMHGTTMGPMQGGAPPPDARSPDYSDCISYGSMEAMDMADNASLGMLLIDQLEAVHGKDGSGQRWDIEGWYGNDYEKLWLRTEGERSGGKLEDGDIEAFWSHTIAAFWNTQLGVRTDAGEGPNRQWAAFGIQGLAPYWFELEATGYVGPAGRTAARFRAEYELFLTQRLILQPELEASAYGKDDAARRLGSGLSDASLGLRLRYEFHRQFAPYVGVVWARRFGGTADLAREDGQDLFDRQWVAGFRIWF
jgi:copper resistance protein B